MNMTSAVWCVGVAGLLLSACVRAQDLGLDVAGTIGANKFDLFAQYSGTASGGDGSVAYRRVTRAMARKALADAKQAGIRYLRVSLSGRTSSVNDKIDSLNLWRSTPEAFWRQVDEMMDDLDAHGIRIVPVLAWGSGKFPAMAGEPLGELLRNPNSKSWQLLARYVTDFVLRYRNRPTVLFYELTNELNNYADLDLLRRCKKKKEACSTDDRFTANDMVAYTTRFAQLVRSLDGSRKVSSGFSIPRPAAEHLRANPEWTTRRTDWRKDTREQFAKNLEEIHSGVDIISIHLYGGEQNSRFGSSDAVDLLVEAKRVADKVGKPLFVGEFGDKEPAAADERSHVTRMMNKLVELRVPYSAVWVWEFYQENTYETHNNRHTAYSLEPGYTDFLIDQIRRMNGGGQARPVGGRDATPPRVVLTWPLPCQTLEGTVRLHAVASDDSGAIKKVDFLLNGVLLYSDQELPYQYTYENAGVKSGKHRLTARAYDHAGNTAEFSSDVLLGRGHSEACSVSMDER